jgi:hypothetical protein
VAVPAQLDAEHSSIPDLGQGRDDRQKIDLALAEHQVLVNATTHVLDVDIRELVAAGHDLLADRHFILAM